MVLSEGILTLLGCIYNFKLPEEKKSESIFVSTRRLPELLLPPTPLPHWTHESLVNSYKVIAPLSLKTVGLFLTGCPQTQETPTKVADHDQNRAR